MFLPGALPFQRFMLKQAGRTVYSKEAGSYASGSTATGRVTQAKEVSAEKPDKERPTTRGYGGVF